MSNNKGNTEKKEDKGDIVTEVTETPEYIIENGLRYVTPYQYTFEVYAKGRWLGRTLLDTLVKEFRAESEDYYNQAITTGRILINGKKVQPSYILVNQDILTHQLHRHEPPVSSQPIEILYDKDDLVVVDKPSSIPVHPCGRYRHNSMTFLLARDHNMPYLRTVHRLDRLTSGLLLFAKNKEKSQEMMKLISERNVQKVYVCKVIGVFPEEPIECNEPIKVIIPRLGLCRVSLDGKECSTRFERLGTDGVTSIVKCLPRTGRTHQIRVHLQYLGHPISNDPLYAHKVWGSAHGRGGVPDSIWDEAVQIINTELAAPPAPIGDLSRVKRPIEEENEREDKRRKIENEQEQESPLKINQETPLNPTNPPENEQEASLKINQETPLNSANSAKKRKERVIFGKGQLPSQHILDVWDANYDELCSECQILRPDPLEADQCIYLHAWRYSGEGWSYQTKLPVWAQGVCLETSTENSSANSMENSSVPILNENGEEVVKLLDSAKEIDEVVLVTDKI